MKETPVRHEDFSQAMLDEIRSFSHIIIRGAGNMGRDILSYLLSEGMEKKKFCFWDKKAATIQNISGVSVLPPFSGNFPTQGSFILHCISTALPYAAEDYTKHGYTHHIDAPLLLCPYRHWTQACHPRPHCTRIQCPRQTKQGFRYIPYSPHAGASAKTLISDRLTFSINTLCTLKCRHCAHYINHFPPEARLNFPLAHIIADIDVACAAHDFIRIGILQGGEPFLHPDFPRILAHFLTQANVGMLEIYSNGICRISGESMAILQNERVHLRISSYAGALNEKQDALLSKNLQRLTERGIAHTLHRPLWNPAPTLLKRECSPATLQHIKAACLCITDSSLVINGIYYPCHYAAYIVLHGLADYPEDKVSLTPGSPRNTLRDRIIALNARPYYQSCAHCDFSNLSVLAGEQGMDARYAHIGKRPA
jgi:hypothetical protein